MDYKYKLSVCITNYNQMQYIEAAVNSIINQTMNFSYEILIGDDGSNDGSFELVQQKYADMTNVRIFRQIREPYKKEHPSWRHSRLIVRLLREVKGEYFVVLDGDDFFCDMESLQRKIDILDDAENTDCILCNSAWCELKNGRYIDNIYKNINRKKTDLSHVFFKNTESYIPFSTAVVRSVVLKNIEEQYTMDFSDTFLYFWTMNYGKRYFDAHITFCYRIHEESIVRTDGELVRNIRAVLSDDIVKCQWGKYHIRRMAVRFWNYIFLYKNRYIFREWNDYEIWYPIAQRYRGWAIRIMEYYKKNRVEKILISIHLYLQLIVSLIGHKIECIFDKEKYLHEV